ncbi:V-set and immunoglobulin domain-containing protein 1 isoform X3 [Dicentrarchus labrax]|uniref:V-set and immunoglobulin domain-containing protein 1 isoform X3 n=1 Tax=Dicentrarchus labrax TaxID=13489 RepID=UPI0021F60B39|nr:V-set and immunoglobulin domain-containing protein 1 isoform X3 [Dicentrarchus labrax]
METREKMICWILLLINLTSCVCGTFVVNVTQTSYQAEENHNITLEWTFTTNTDSSLNSLSVYCELITDQKVSVLYYLHEGVTVPQSQDEQFKGRVQCDKDVLREGQIRLHVSRLRTEDSGLYLCEVNTTYGVSYSECRLSVTAVVEAKPQRPTVRPQPESPQPERRGRIGLYVGLTAVLLAVCVGLCSASCHCFTKSADKKGNVSVAV